MTKEEIDWKEKELPERLTRAICDIAIFAIENDLKHPPAEYGKWRKEGISLQMKLRDILREALTTNPC